MEANEASLGSGDATTRAQELRASLGARQDAESMLAEASRIRQEAVASADALVEEAQQLSAQLVRESRELADQQAAESRERSDGILARARLEAEELADRARATADAIRAKAEADVEEHRRRVRAEVTDQVTRDLTEKYERQVTSAREQSESLISDLEASVRILGVSLESALSNVSELLGSLDSLRSTTEAGPTHVTQPEPARPESARPEPARPEPARPEPVRAADPVGDHLIRATVPEVGAEVGAEVEPESTVAEAADALEAPQPIEESDQSSSYDVGNPAPATAVPSPVSQFSAEEPEEEPDEDLARPRTATEAFLLSNSLEIDQASRELRDLQHPEEARRRRSEESRRAAQRRELEDGLSDDSGPDPDPEPARPLGWLFRTAQ